MRLGSRSANVRLESITPRLVPGHRPTWGRQERVLPAPLTLLEYLVQHVTEQQVESSGDVGAVRDRRHALARHDSHAVEEALNLLRSERFGRHWYVLEGRSRPDATLEMPNAVLVLEGKRTERTCTSTTKWMRLRSQLVRHMDAAQDAFPTKRILGLLVVEGDASSNPMTPSQHWRDQSEAQHSTEMLEQSLPHRTPIERKQLADGVLGVATWQAVCAQNGIPWPPTSI
jgi:hypothetical protein